MVHSAAPSLLLAEVLSSLEFWSYGVAAASLTIVGLQMWRGRAAQRQFALDLAEAERAALETRERNTALGRQSQAKSEMLATLSREVRSHLNGIIGSADLLLDEPLGPLPRQHLSTLRASAESLHRSVNDVLDYSSLETGLLRIAEAPFELASPFIEVIEELSPLAALKSLDLVLILAPDAPRQVIGDPARLRQIVLNLAVNAVKAAPSGRVVLRVGRAAERATDGSGGAAGLHISVSDTGPGLPEELQATLFERPGDADSASARRYGGSGLELAISKRLVELMGGSIGAHNLAGNGFEFWVTLPLRADPEDATPTSVSAPEGVHVVALDSDPASRVAMSALLTRLGVEHDITDVLAKALDHLRASDREGAREQVLLADETIAATGTSELVRQLRDDPALRTTRVVLLARNPDAAAAVGTAVSAVAVLRKPLLRLEPVVEALARGRDQTAAPATARERPLVLVVDDD